MTIDENVAFMILGGFLFIFAMLFVYAFRKVALQKYHVSSINPDDYTKTTAKVLEKSAYNDDVHITWQEDTGTEFYGYADMTEDTNVLEIWYENKNPENFLTDEKLQQILDDSQYNGTYVHSLTVRVAIGFLMVGMLVISLSVFGMGLIRLLHSA